jgi:hypothetical protein
MPHSRRVVLSGLLASSVVAAGAKERPRIADLYRGGEGPTALALSLAGQRVSLDGFMAPPLRADGRFFVLMTTPSPLCPFCDDAEEWPESIIAVFTKRPFSPAPFYKPIVATGTLAIGERVDPGTGFVSAIWLENGDFSMT